VQLNIQPSEIYHASRHCFHCTLRILLRRSSGWFRSYLQKEVVLVLQQHVVGSVPAPRGVVLVLLQQAAGSVPASKEIVLVLQPQHAILNTNTVTAPLTHTQCVCNWYASCDIESKANPGNSRAVVGLNKCFLVFRQEMWCRVGIHISQQLVSRQYFVLHQLPSDESRDVECICLVF
jgi:hypothetical protein